MGRVASASVPRADWSEIRGTIRLGDVATQLLGPAPGRRGERGRKLWWSCPFHQDRNPSFAVDPEKSSWCCYGCGAKGDAIDLVRGLSPGMSFPDAVAFLAGEAPAPSIAISRREASPKVARDRPSGMTRAAALALVEDAERRLSSEEGETALAYLYSRGLAFESILAARLGWTPRAEGVPWKPPGIVIPWFEGDELAMVKVRPPGEWRLRFPEEKRPPKYLEGFRDPARVACYPGAETIQPGRPLAVVEGELDAILLDQELSGLARAVTLGSASARPTPDLLGRILGAFPWYVATDNDHAGDAAGEAWPEHCRRIRPPGTFKDWTEAHQGGVNLRRWWSEILRGVERPALFTWEEARELRWGPAIGDPEPGLDVVPSDWRWTVACWSHDRWVEWRRRSGEMQPPSPTVEQIRDADRRAYEELKGGGGTR